MNSHHRCAQLDRGLSDCAGCITEPEQCLFGSEWTDIAINGGKASIQSLISTGIAPRMDSAEKSATRHLALKSRYGSRVERRFSG
jgi:hypothetical protein